MKEFQRKIAVPALALTGEITGYCLVQGWGTIKGFPFYLWARWNEWSFAISERPDVDPINIQMPATGEQYGFFKEKIIGKEWENLASWMELQEAERIIIECCEEYIRIKNIS